MHISKNDTYRLCASIISIQVYKHTSIISIQVYKSPGFTNTHIHQAHKQV